MRRLVLIAPALVLAACGTSNGTVHLVTATTSTTPPPTITVTTSALPHAASSSRASRSEPSRSPRGGTASLSGSSAGDLYDRLAMCESHMNATANTGNGFYGAFQFMLSTWHSLGETGNPVDYSYAYQKAVVVRSIPISSWHRQFPACSRQIGA